MTVPPHGLSVPAAWSHLTRADQLVLTIASRRVRVNLIGCRAPSPTTPEGRDAMHWLEAWLEAAADRPVSLWLPWRGSMADLAAQCGIAPLLVGRVFCGTTDLSDLLLAHGHALPVSGDSPQN